jgi:hypothetical protein
MKWVYPACAVVLTACVIWGGMGANRHLIEALDAWKQSAPDLKPTLDAINRPGTGTIAEANKTIVKVGDAIVMTQLQERSIAPHTVAAVDALKVSATKLGSSADALTGAANEASQLTAALTVDAKTANASIAGIQPLETAFTQDAADLDALLKDRAITDTLTNVQFTTQNIGGITADFERVTHKAADDYLAPKPWYRKVGGYAGDAIDYGAFIARHY